ncbi:MAG: FAD-binding oxidoreductase [Burkholderiales bacterium]|nr:FAD-binding oxidoreductase [Burkholderiales bacterium]
MARTDVLIVGGGAIGSAAALFLRRAPRAPTVTVIEPDPTYALASTPRATGGVRRLFSCPENIRMSQASMAFFDRFAEQVAVAGEAPDLGWKAGGYLFVVDERAAPILERNARLQQSLGVEVHLLDRAALGARYPSMRTDDLTLAAWSPGDGWLDPNAVLTGLRRKAQDLGAAYVRDRVVGIARDGARVGAVRLASGREIAAGAVVNAAGAWSADVCAMIGMALPVSPMRRFEHYVEIAGTLEPLPLIKDLDRLVLRPEGRGYSVGLVDGSEQRGYRFDVDHTYFPRVVWPALAHRLPAFEALRLKSEWSGLYDENELDGNMILGNWPGRAENFYVAAGFSGHGLMHAPAVGQALAELIVGGRYVSLDLSRLDYRRVMAGAPYREQGIV